MADHRRQPSSFSRCPGRSEYRGALSLLARASAAISQPYSRAIELSVSPRSTRCSRAALAGAGVAGATAVMPSAVADPFALPAAAPTCTVLTCPIRTIADLASLRTSVRASSARGPDTHQRLYRPTILVV